MTWGRVLRPVNAVCFASCLADGRARAGGWAAVATEGGGLSASTRYVGGLIAGHLSCSVSEAASVASCQARIL